MSDINFIIAKKDELKSLIYQWLDEHPHFLFQASEKEKESDRSKIIIQYKNGFISSFCRGYFNING